MPDSARCVARLGAFSFFSYLDFFECALFSHPLISEPHCVRRTFSAHNCQAWRSGRALGREPPSVRIAHRIGSLRRLIRANDECRGSPLDLLRVRRLCLFQHVYRICRRTIRALLIGIPESRAGRNQGTCAGAAVRTDWPRPGSCDWSEGHLDSQARSWSRPSTVQSIICPSTSRAEIFRRLFSSLRAITFASVSSRQSTI